MNYEFIINFCIRFFRKYKKEIVWWTFVIIFSRTINFNHFAYRPEDYAAELEKSKKSKESKESKEE